MYRELEAELARKGWTKKDLAKATSIRYETLIVKLSGKFSLTLDESLKIKEAIGSKLPLEALFFNN